MRRTYKRAREGVVIPLPMSSPELLSEDTPPAPEGGSLSTLSTWLGVSHLLTQPRPPPLTVAASRPTAPIPLSTSLATNTGVGVGAGAVLQQLPWTTGKDHSLVGLLEGSGCGEEKPAAAATTSSTSTTTASSPPAPSSPPHLPQPPPRMVQLHLDLGQRGFDQTKCRLCAMVYCPGVAEDEALHTSQCAKVASGVVTWAMAPKDDVVWGPGEDGIRVIHVQPGGGGAGSHRVESVAALLLRMLGPHSVPKVREEGGDGEGGEDGSSGSSSSSGGGSSSGPIPLHHYIAVGQGGGVVGALSTHLLRPPLTKFVVVEEGEGGVSGGGGGGRGLVRKPLEAKAVIGIDQVWVSAGVRRRGIGKVLIDAARKHTVYAYTVPVGEVAFSAPTGDGFLLAAAYRGGVGEGGKRFVPVY